MLRSSSKLTITTGTCKMPLIYFLFFFYRFICEDTIEEKILKIQNEKMSLAESALTGAKRSASKLTIEDLKDLFGMK